ncbi:MAG: SRPBCC domain-containing protein [Caulobacteraceae bacterium]|nr:SRPBCC domain-containing protein [Caulobacter sp.]
MEHRIGIAAPATRVWEVLADLEGWAAWNPLHPKAEGRLSIGAPLAVELHVPGDAPTTQRVSVIDWVPNEQIVWAARYGGGFMRSTRYMEIEALSEAGCVFSNGEIFAGLGARFAPKSLRARTRQGLVAMSEALKARAEARVGAAAAA